jgi:putative DNA primase/helicase
VRFLHGQPFTYNPQFKIAIIGNSEPSLRHVDSAMLRRIRIVPMNVPVPRAEQIADMSERMVAEEGPAILQWMIDGCVEWQRVGLTASAAVLKRTEEYADEEDMIGQWIAEECELGEDYVSTRDELFAAWQQWCRRGGEPAGTKRTFRTTIKPVERRFGLHNAQIGPRRLRGYRGIRLRSEIGEGTEFTT